MLQLLVLLVIPGLFVNAGSLALSLRPKIRRDCNLPKADALCLGRIPRYYFDPVSRQCKMFRGCRGNENNFKTKQDCEANCNGPCFLPKITGHCRARFSRYYFNFDTKKCQKFIYGGCGGNSNNFKTIEECYKACPYL